MVPRRRAFVGGVLGTVAVSGCLGSGGSGPVAADTTDTDATETRASDTTDTADDGDGHECRPAVQVRSHPDYGPVLVGPDEMTLYMFDSDTRGAGASTCYDGCADSWPPLTVEDALLKGPEVTAVLETFEREDGAMQVAANGWPLYYFQADENPGDVNGQGVNDVWWVLDAAGTPVKPDRETTSPTEDGGSY